jgi:hypothetical protein
MNGFVLYEGPSMLDGAPIVVVATGFADKSANAKTGGIIQTWILRQDVPPHRAFKSSEGGSVCGDCPHKLNQTCYVPWHQAPLAVWNCYRRGGYPPLPSPAVFSDRILRLGSAGDPAAVPFAIWGAILPWVASHTGYTHQWRNSVGAPLLGTCQASCDSAADLEDARAAGWRTFSVLPLGAIDPVGVVHCAASKERGAKTDCATCRLCDGASADVAIIAHGIHSKRIK